EEDERMEKAIISGVPHDTSEAKVTLVRVPDRPGIAARILPPLARQGVNVAMIVQNGSHGGLTDISFTVPKADLQQAMVVLEKIRDEVGAGEVLADQDIAKGSLVGAGMKSNPGVAAAMFEALAEAGINIEMISTSTIRISCGIRADDVGTAGRASPKRGGDPPPPGRHLWRDRRGRGGPRGRPHPRPLPPVGGCRLPPR